MRKMVCTLLCCAGAALFLSACGEQKKSPEGKVESAVKETARAVDKTADYATGKTQLEQKKKLENKLNKIQGDQQKQLEDALK
mgnify:FL=1